jgi:transcriptional regulator PpsR
MSEKTAPGLDLSGLASFAPELAAAFASVASDIALVIDSAGYVRNVALAAGQTSQSPQDWVGKRWIDTVTSETRRKVDLLLEEATTSGFAKRREVNHPALNGSSIPMAYSAIRLGHNGPVVVAGRDLRAVAAIQQRFLEVQKEMERTYWQSRKAEARYRLLFQVATDAVWIVDADTMQVAEANPAALALQPTPDTLLTGADAASLFETASRAAMRELLQAARTTGRPAEIRARLLGQKGTMEVAATPFRTDTSLMLLVRARQAQGRPTGFESTTYLADFVEKTPDAVVVTDSSGRITVSNPAFCKLCDLQGEAEAHGQLLNDVVGDPRQPFNRLLSQVRRTGVAGQARMTVRTGGGRNLSLDVSATLLAEGDQECAGFIIRPLATLVGSAAPLTGSDSLRMAMDQLVQQLGKVPLQELMLQVNHLAEKHLVEVALADCGGSADRAAHILGISHESMAMRVERLGLNVAPESGRMSLH